MITALLLVTFGSAFGRVQLSKEDPVVLSKYTFDKTIANNHLTDIIFPGEKNTIYLSGANAKWLYIKDHSIFVKKNFLKKVLSENELQFTIEFIRSNKKFKQKKFTLLNDHFNNNKVIAHRGAWKNSGTPENSIAALKAAIALNCTGSETDVHMTSDSVLVINHDNDWGGITIQKNTLEDLRKKNLSNGEPLPLLHDFLEVIKQQSGTRLILEIKPSVRGKEWADATVRKIVNSVHLMQAQAWITYISFDYEMLKEVLRLEPSANVQYLNGDRSPEQLKQDGIKGADYHYSVFQKHPEWIQSAKENNIDLNAWTVNEEKDMNFVLANDFNFITTNEPELLFKESEKSPVARGMKSQSPKL